VQEAWSLARNVLEDSDREVYDLPFVKPRSVDRLRRVAFVGPHVSGDQKLAPHFGKESQRELRARRRLTHAEQDPGARVVEEKVSALGPRPNRTRRIDHSKV
jgi:hypothetical protein